MVVIEKRWLSSKRDYFYQKEMAISEMKRQSAKWDGSHAKEMAASERRCPRRQENEIKAMVKMYLMDVAGHARSCDKYYLSGTKKDLLMVRWSLQRPTRCRWRDTIETKTMTLFVKGGRRSLFVFVEMCRIRFQRYALCSCV